MRTRQRRWRSSTRCANHSVVSLRVNFGLCGSMRGTMARGSALVQLLGVSEHALMQRGLLEADGSRSRRIAASLSPSRLASMSAAYSVSPRGAWLARGSRTHGEHCPAAAKRLDRWREAGVAQPLT